MTRRLAFAVPGKITNLTGGTIYDRRVIGALRDQGIDVAHIELPGSFPNPTPDDMRHALALLASVPRDVPLIVDGLAFGALDPVAVRRLAAPLVALVHHPLAEETGLPSERRTHFHETESKNLECAHHVIVPSPHTAEILQTRYGVPATKVSVARPGTDRTTFEPSPLEPPMILAVGIQLRRKGHDVLMKALAQITDLEWTAKIVGAPLDPSYATQLTDLQEDLGLTDRVALCGQVERDQLGGLYAQASVFALATRYEGYGIVFDEALAAGLPIVSCATGAVPDTVPRDAGLLVAPDDELAFEAALRQVLEDSDRRQEMAKAAKLAGDALPSWADTAATVALAIREHVKATGHG